MKKRILSTSEAAKLLGISRIAVFKKIRQGRMAATMFGGSYVITRAAVSQEKMRIEKRERARVLRRKKRCKN